MSSAVTSPRSALVLGLLLLAVLLAMLWLVASLAKRVARSQSVHLHAGKFDVELDGVVDEERHERQASAKTLAEDVSVTRRTDNRT